MLDVVRIESRVVVSVLEVSVLSVEVAVLVTVAVVVIEATSVLVRVSVVVAVFVVMETVVAVALGILMQEQASEIAEDANFLRNGGRALGCIAGASGEGGALRRTAGSV